MDTISRKVGGQFKTFDILTKEVADLRGITYLPWRECRVGEWGLSDDGYVSECLQAMEYTDKKHRTKRIFTFPFARVFEGKGTRLLWEPRKATGNYHDAKNRTWQEKEAAKTRTVNAVKLYVQQLLKGKIDWDAVGEAYRPDQQIPAATVRRLFKEERIQAMITAELETILREKGITKQFIIEQYLKAIQVAELKGDASAIIKVADRLAPMVGIETSGKQLPPPTDDNLGNYAEALLQHESERKQLEKHDESAS